MNIPNMIPLQFKGIKKVKTLYAGIDPVTNLKVECDIDKKDSCLVQVSPTKARQLLVDFPEEWVLVGKAVDTEPLHEALMAYVPVDRPLANMSASKNTIIIEPDGKQTEVPAGATIHIITPPDDAKPKSSILGGKKK